VVIIIEDDDICWLVFSVRALIKSDSWLWKINRQWRASTWGFFLFFYIYIKEMCPRWWCSASDSISSAPDNSFPFPQLLPFSFTTLPLPILLSQFSLFLFSFSFIWWELKMVTLAVPRLPNLFKKKNYQFTLYGEWVSFWSKIFIYSITY
jgi:hypothetical protein